MMKKNNNPTIRYIRQMEINKLKWIEKKIVSVFTRRTWWASGSPHELIYCNNLISSMLWSKKSLLFLITFKQTHCASAASAIKSAHCKAVEKAAWPSISETSYLPAIIVPFTGLKCLFYKDIHSFIHSFIHSYSHSFIHSFIHSYSHSFIHSFIHSWMRHKLKSKVKSIFKAKIWI